MQKNSLNSQHFSNIEWTQTCSSIDDQTQTPYFVLEHQTLKLIGPLLYLLTFSSSRLEYPFINIERIWMRSSFGNQTRTSNFEHSLTWKSADMNIAFRFISWPWKKYFIQQTLPTKSFSNDFFSQRTFGATGEKEFLKFKLRMVIAKLYRFYPLRNVRITIIEISSKENTIV